MSKAFKRIEKSLKDAIAFAQGKSIEVMINKPSLVNSPAVAYIGSPQLAHPEQAADFRKEVIDGKRDTDARQ
ncbi:hypothetical protein L0244_38090 [bacterium]|nr:hypothetical protein [bacterium]